MNEVRDKDLEESKTWRKEVRTKNIRLDKYLARTSFPFSRSKIKKKINEKQILVNGEESKPSYSVKKGDIIQAVYKSSDKSVEIKPEKIPVSILYEDRDIIVLNKQKSMVVHPAKGNPDGTLVNALLYHCEDLAEGSGMDRPGVIHRLDEDTTGVIVFAKNERALSEISIQFQERKVVKNYLAVVWGKPPLKEGEINAPIGRSPFNRKLMAVTPLKSKDSLTRFKVLYSYGFASVLQVILETGRTHQIRVHLSHFGYPVIGDPDYKGRDRRILRKIGSKHQEIFDVAMEIMCRQALHAASLEFIHPVKKKQMRFTAPLHKDMRELIDFFNKSVTNKT